LACT